MEFGNRGMPPQNLAAVKAFLAAQRPHEETQPEAHAAKPRKPRLHKGVQSLPRTCRFLPASSQNKLADFFKQISELEYLKKPDGKPLPKWRVFYGATVDEAWGAANKAAHEYDTPGDSGMSTGWNDAYNAACSAAAKSHPRREEARKDVHLAAWNASQNASGLLSVNGPSTYAALVASLIAVEDIDFSGKIEHMNHAKGLWEVWKKGYGLAAVVDDTLFVFCVGQPSAGQSAPKMF